MGYAKRIGYLRRAFGVTLERLIYLERTTLQPEFGAVIEDDDDTNVDIEKELSLEQKLILAIIKKISANQNAVQKLAVSKTIRREIDLFENMRDLQELWFQQDGATCHTARATIDLLKDTFGDRLISRFGPVNWPPRSCDLTPLDYFLWGCVKSLVYADKPQTLNHLEDNIHHVIADIRPQMLEKVIENWTSRLDYIRASRGSHMPEIIFKM
ncbi:transposable element Tc3 transposase [Trichonephila clavipes]|nr:transposable element Tc3 transposase [Trichonephila clavipes]